MLAISWKWEGKRKKKKEENQEFAWVMIYSPNKEIKSIEKVPRSVFCTLFDYVCYTATQNWRNFSEFCIYFPLPYFYLVEWSFSYDWLHFFSWPSWCCKDKEWETKTEFLGVFLLNTSICVKSDYLIWKYTLLINYFEKKLDRHNVLFFAMA